MPELVSTVNGRDDEASPSQPYRQAPRPARTARKRYEWPHVSAASVVTPLKRPKALRGLSRRRRPHWAQSRRRWTSTGSLAVAAVVLGGLAILSGFGGNSAVLLLGIVAVGLGVWARVQNKRGPALCGIALAAFSPLGYVGTLVQPSSAQQQAISPLAAATASETSGTRAVRPHRDAIEAHAQRATLLLQTANDYTIGDEATTFRAVAAEYESAAQAASGDYLVAEPLAAIASIYRRAADIEVAGAPWDARLGTAATADARPQAGVVLGPVIGHLEAFRREMDARRVPDC